MEELITAITASSLTLHWQLHTSCSSASTNLKWPVMLPAQFNTKKLKLVKEGKEKICKCYKGVYVLKIFLSTSWKRHCCSLPVDFSFCFLRKPRKCISIPGMLASQSNILVITYLYLAFKVPFPQVT